MSGTMPGGAADTRGSRLNRLVMEPESDSTWSYQRIRVRKVTPRGGEASCAPSRSTVTLTSSASLLR